MSVSVLNSADELSAIGDALVLVAVMDVRIVTMRVALALMHMRMRMRFVSRPREVVAVSMVRIMHMSM